MKKIIIIAILIVLVFTLASCAPSKIEGKKALIIQKILDVNKVPYTTITLFGDKAEITYETSDATNYDAQIISDWGMIFAAAANFNYKEITIVNTINGEPIARLSTSSENVNLLGNDQINESEFWNAVEIKAVN